MASGANLPLMHGLGGEPPVDADDADDVHDADDADDDDEDDDRHADDDTYDLQLSVYLLYLIL